MTKPNFTFFTIKIVVLFVLCCAASTVSFAQTETRGAQSEPSYEVVLQVLVGSNETGQKTAAPANLSAVTKKINNNFAFSNYRLSNTYISRAGNTGSIEYKSYSNDFGQIPERDTPVFLDWSFVGLKNAPGTGKQNAVHIQSFRFGARVPVKTGSFKDEAGKISSVVNYENIGLTLQKISVPENTATLIGTLPTTKIGETIFLVLTVKPVEEQ